MCKYIYIYINMLEECESADSDRALYSRVYLDEKEEGSKSRGSRALI